MNNENKKDTVELTAEQMEKVAGGDASERDWETECDHRGYDFAWLGESKIVNFEEYFLVMCVNCHEKMWVKKSDLIGPATKTKEETIVNP